MLMIDNDTPVKGSPLNGCVQVCVSREGNYQEINLDFESVWLDKGKVVFKCYDQGANVIYVKMDVEVVWDGVMEGKVLTLPVGPPC